MWTYQTDYINESENVKVKAAEKMFIDKKNSALAVDEFRIYDQP